MHKKNWLHAFNSLDPSSWWRNNNMHTMIAHFNFLHHQQLTIMIYTISLLLPQRNYIWYTFLIIIVFTAVCPACNRLIQKYSFAIAGPICKHKCMNANYVYSFLCEVDIAPLLVTSFFQILIRSARQGLLAQISLSRPPQPPPPAILPCLRLTPSSYGLVDRVFNFFQ
jgi:hypothetical protein